MVFKCQEDSFLRQFTTVVKTVEKAEGGGWNVTFEDTILFPEGGGQPTDHGKINELSVSSVTRKGAEAIHLISLEGDLPLKVGDEVTQEVDWARRHDHMQQHSGQHLITAVFEREFKMVTKSWWLGSDDCYIELVTPDVSLDQMRRVERVANELIAANTPVTIEYIDPSDPEIAKVRSAKEVPEDVVGPLRICNIQGVDRNLCCGTHVASLSQLQVVKLLYVEKPKGKLLVHFLVGNRVVERLQRCLEREQQLNLALNGGPESHVELVKKIQSTVKSNQKLLKNLAKEVAVSEAQKFKSSEEKRFHILHRHDGLEPDFLATFLKNVGNAPETLFFLTVGDEKQGSVQLQGPTEAVEALGPEIMKLLEGKGNGKGGRFQGKASSFKKIKECDKMVAQLFENAEK